VNYSTNYVFPKASDGSLSSNPTYAKQVTGDGSNTGTWTYAATVNSQGLVTQLKVTDPAGNMLRTELSANGDKLDGVPLKQEFAVSPTPPSPPSPLKTITTDWDLDSSGMNPRPKSITTTL